jgi:hypothetical protein
MTDHDLPPELRRRRTSHPEVVPLELPLDDDLPPLLNPDLAAVEKQRNPEPFLRRS